MRADSACGQPVNVWSTSAARWSQGQGRDRLRDGVPVLHADDDLGPGADGRGVSSAPGPGSAGGSAAGCGGG